MSSRPGPVSVTVHRHADRLDVRWSDGRTSGSCRFDHIAEASPQWLGSAEELLEGTDRRLEGRVIAAVAEWAAAEGLDLGIWHDDAGIELLAE